MEQKPAVILVVDDNPANLNLLFDLLDHTGFEVLVSQSGESAIKRAEKAQPDLILLDVMMPDMDGFETCLQLKAQTTTKTIPVIFMTALSDTVDKVKGFELGAVDYITKPIQPEEVLVRIRTHLTIQRLQNDLHLKNQELQSALGREQDLNQLKSRFLSMASHEFRTPLTTISLSSSVLRRYGGKMSDEKRLEECQTIERAVKQMTELLNDVLIIAKGETGHIEFQPEPTILKHVCQQIVDTYNTLSEGIHTIAFTFTGSSTPVAVDPKLLYHILSNLLSNAIKYSPIRKTITFDVEQNMTAMVFRILDEGVGIPETDQAHLFETFHRGANVRKIPGTGLGLVIVKQFVELHGGTITFHSIENQGTTFTVTLPIRKELVKTADK